jgi:peroxiredoxin
MDIDGKPFDSLTLTTPEGTITLLSDPQTHLLRRVSIDFISGLLAKGAQDVKAASLVIDYTQMEVPAAAAPSDAFVFTPPADAKDEGTLAAKAKQEDKPAEELLKPEEASQGLVGKPAPDFSVSDLNGNTVKLSDLKGSVVLLDFWATWCAPCIAGLPQIDQFNQAYQAKGLKVFTVNLSESKSRVARFVAERNLQLPVLMDTDGAVAQAYKLFAPPLYVLIGKDGVVKKVWIGPISDKSEMQQAIESSLAQ